MAAVRASSRCSTRVITMGPSSMALQVELALEGVVDRFDELTQGLQESASLARRLAFPGGSDEVGVMRVEEGLELGAGVALAGEDRLPGAGRQQVRLDRE